MIVRLEAIHFASNSSFVGTPRLDFEGHFSGLNSSLPRYFEYNAHHPVVEGEDDGVRLVKLHGLVFVPYGTAEIALKQVPQALIAEFISRAFVILGLQDRAFDPALYLMQASFTAREDGTYTGHIRTRQDPQRVEFAAGYYRGNALIAHLRYAFPVHFLLEPGANVYQKEDRVERRTGA